MALSRGLPIPSATVSALDFGGELEALWDKALVRPARAAFADEAAFRFRHLLVRDAAYNATTKRIRAQLHERFADWLEGVNAERIGEVEEMAGHDLEQAFRYLDQLRPAERPDLAARAARALGRRRATSRRSR